MKNLINKDSLYIVATAIGNLQIPLRQNNLYQKAIALKNG